MARNGIPRSDSTIITLVAWAVASAVIGGATSAAAVVGGQRPAGILVFPDIAVNQAQSTDTLIEIANIRNAPITVQCFWVNANSHCGGPFGPICSEDADCPAGLRCEPGWAVTDFTFELTANQALGWSAESGLDPLPCAPPMPPCPGLNDGMVIPVPEIPFVGELKCVQLSNANEFPALAPVARNDLIGAATVVRRNPSFGATDARSYTAVGIEAIGANNGDTTLCLGGADGGACTPGEYAGCPAVLSTNLYFEGAVTAFASIVGGSRVILTPCAENFATGSPTTAEAQFMVINEFEQPLSLSTTVTCWKELPLSSNPIFSIGVQGTLTGQARIRGVNQVGSEPLIGVMVESHVGLMGGPTREAAYHLGAFGQSEQNGAIQLP
jgi:hypothetical protein